MKHAWHCFRIAALRGFRRYSNIAAPLWLPPPWFDCDTSTKVTGRTSHPFSFLAAEECERGGEIILIAQYHDLTQSEMRHWMSARKELCPRWPGVQDDNESGRELACLSPGASGRACTEYERLLPLASTLSRPDRQADHQRYGLRGSKVEDSPDGTHIVAHIITDAV